jgi:AcrR family transcriptional regulator
MVRWEPGTAQRLQRAALDLFASRGFEQTTAAEIAQSVGLTERTFFRHFSDKREVLFDGQQRLVQVFIDGARSAPPEASAIEAVEAALSNAASFFAEERRSFSRKRQQVIDQNPALQERERNKLADLAAALADALRARGASEMAARLAAQSGATVFGIAFRQWIREDEDRSFAAIQAEVFAELRAVTGKTGTPQAVA